MPTKEKLYQRVEVGKYAKLQRDKAALVTALEEFLARMNDHGEWDDGCFYYNRVSASELQYAIEFSNAVLQKAKA